MQDAVKLVEQGQFQKAQEAFEALYKQDTKNPDYLYYLGYIALKQDRFDEALEYLNKAEKHNENDPRIYEALGEAYGFKAQRSGPLKGAMLVPKAKKAFQRALELDAESIRAREGLFMFYLFLPGMAGGDENKAQELADEIAQHDAAHGHMAKALILAKQKKSEQAETEFSKASELAPEDMEIQLRAGMFFLQINKNEQAVRLFSGALNSNPEFAPAKFNRARAYKNLGQVEQAKADLNDIIAAVPDSALGKQAREMLAKL